MKLNISSSQNYRFIKLLAVCLVALGAILLLATTVSAEAAQTLWKSEYIVTHPVIAVVVG